MSSNFYIEVIQPSPLFPSRDRVNIISLLEPITAARVVDILSAAKQQGILLMIYETYRSPQRQAQLFAQGATHLHTVGVHHYGLACDIVRDIDGEPSWKGDWTFLRDLAKASGMISGLDWGQPGVKHSFVDSVHVQRCRVADQQGLFSGSWYPDENYDPYKS